MTNLNRRQWLRTTGLASAATLLGGLSLEGRTATTAISRPLPAGMPARLNSNENPYGPSERVRQAMIEGFEIACRYPSAYRGALLEQIAQKEGVSPDHIVLVAGSTEGLRITGLTYGQYGGEILAAKPTFLALLSYAEKFGGYVNSVPLTEDLQHDLDEMERRIHSRTSLVFLCNPNNPTGTLLPKNDLEQFCRNASRRTVVFSDEAYYDYITEPDYPSMVKLVKEGLNVIVSRTFSKVYGLAGIRVGYLVARPDIADRLLGNRVAMNNVVGLHAASTALQDDAFYRFSLQKNTEAKQMIYNTLDELGLFYHRSHTNFVFFKTDRDIAQLNTAMRKKNVLIGRPFPPLTDWCRISTGTLEEVEMFCNALKKVI